MADPHSSAPHARAWALPQEDGLGLRRIASASGLSVSLLPNGAIFAIEHESAAGRIMINQVLGSPLDGGIGRLLLRAGPAGSAPIEITGPKAALRVGVGDDHIVWEGESAGFSHRVVLSLHPTLPGWFWQVDLRDLTPEAGEAGGLKRCDVVLLQDIGLGDRGFLMNNEAYASQYIDHCIESHERFGPVILNRQNLDQGGRHPWVAHGCIDGAASFATDAAQVFGPGFRDAAGVALPVGCDLPGIRLQREVACPSLQSRPLALGAGASASVSFFGLFMPDHPGASGVADFAALDALAAGHNLPPVLASAKPIARAIPASAPPLAVRDLDGAAIAALYPERVSEEQDDGGLLSFFVEHGQLNRHVVLRRKELLVERRHGAILRSGRAVLPQDDLLCATFWMHGVFGAQLTLGNTSFHKLFSVSRDPFNITRTSGLRIYADQGQGWRLLSVPSLFDIGLSDCRWLYDTDAGRITVAVRADADDAALRWSITTDGAACRFLISGHCVMGERELGQGASVSFDDQRRRISFRPEAGSLWGDHYPNAVYHWVSDTPEIIEAIGGSDLLAEGADAPAPVGPYAVMRTGATQAVSFALVGDLTDEARAQRLADAWSGARNHEAAAAGADAHWEAMTRGLKLGGAPAIANISLALPWLVQNAIIHVSVPHGLEQYTGGAWGTRDVCQGPIEMLLPLGHDAAAKQVMLRVFAEQYEERGDWSQWFMLEPYSFIRDRSAHGDVIVWPLKMVCDYIESTGDTPCLEEMVGWRRYDDSKQSERRDSLAAHIDVLLATVKARFLPGTHLIRIGEGDWNDSLQPADAHGKERMVSSWTVALLYQQLRRYAAILVRVGRDEQAAELERMASAMRVELNSYLIVDGVVAGYGIFDAGADKPRLLLHPSDSHTGVHYSMLPMARAIAGGLFTPEQTAEHLELIGAHLTFPDGVRLMDKPMPYHGGLETIFRRAESSAYFGREIGLMYVHGHLQYGQAVAALLRQADADDEARGETTTARSDRLAAELLVALAQVGPAGMAGVVPNASLRQRNTYFSSSDSAFRDRAQASAEWDRVKQGSIAADGGWRIYSSGPGLFLDLAVRALLGISRRDGAWHIAPRMSALGEGGSIEMQIDGERRQWNAPAV